MNPKALAITGILTLGLACSCSSGFGSLTSQARLVVTVEAGNLGSKQNPLPLAFTPQTPVTLRIEAHRADGSLDDGYDSFVRLSVKPGTVYSVNGGADGRNVQLKNGVATGVSVPLVASYGETHVWAEDLGFVPVNNLDRQPPPACSDGIDNNGNGKIDFPADPGCFAPNDDTEDGGTYAAGASPLITYALPHISDVRGLSLNGGSATAFPGEQVRIDTGFDDATQTFARDVVVTRIASDGFYVTDVPDQAATGFASVFAFTFSAPTKLRVCDRMRAFSGTASDFYGFTEIGFPTWSVEYYDPAARHCLVPEPYVLGINDLANVRSLFRYESSMVRVLSQGTVTAHITMHFGPDHPAAPAYMPTQNASNCDFNNNSKVDFGDPVEAACANACTADNECSEFSGFLTQSNFFLVLVDSMSAATAKAQVNGAAAPGFDPLSLKNQTPMQPFPIKSFTGTLRYFSGGTQFTVEARCGDDIVVDMNAMPASSDTACVRPRTDLELSQGN